MQHLLILTFCSLLPGLLSAQIAFFKAYADGGYSTGEGIVQLADSSYLVTGSSSSFDANSTEAYIMQVDSMGNQLWAYHYGGLESDKGRRIFHVPNDGIYVAGQSNSFGNTFFDAYFFKTDESGNLLYQKHYGGSAYEDIHDAVMLPDTSFFLVGESASTVDEVEDLYLLRINKNGDTLWTKTFGSSGKDVAHGVEMLNDTTVIVVGEYYVADSLTQKAMILRMHTDGTVQWMKTFGNQGKYVLKDINIFQDTLRSVGYNQSNLSVEGNNYLFRMICTADGIYPGMANEVNNGDYSIECIVKYSSDPNNYYYAKKITNNPDIPTYLDGADIIIYKYGMNLYFNNAAFIPSNTGDDDPNEMIATSDGGAIMVGTSELPLHGGSNAILVKIGPNDFFPYSNTLPSFSTLVSVQEVQQHSSLSVYPNPADDYLVVHANPGSKLRISNQLGQLVYECKITEASQYVNLEAFEKGCYLLEFEENGVLSRTKFIRN